MRHRIRDAQTHLESLQEVKQTLEKHADDLDANMHIGSYAIGTAYTALEEARFDHVLSQYVSAILPAIKLAGEVRALAARGASLRVGKLESSGLLLDPKNPTIGSFRILEDGSIT